VCRLVLVSTLDGRLSALDPSNGGSVNWSIDTGPGQMLSSSIHRLEVTTLCTGLMLLHR
jgi:translation initiation factor 2-alpha kinase 3